VCVCVCVCVGGAGKRPGGSAATAPVALRRRVFQDLVPVVGRQVAVALDALVHLLADDVHEALEHLLHVDVVLGADLEELETWRGEGGGSATRMRMRHLTWAEDEYRGPPPAAGRPPWGRTGRPPGHTCCRPGSPERCPTSTS